MHPAASIVAFTTLSGFGYGLAAVLALGALDPEATATAFAHILALSLIAGGLLASTLHLGNPKRAWRAFSQWRSSWLSREGVLAVATFAPLLVSAGLAILFGRSSLVLGAIIAVLCAATVYCTAMIYASLRSIQAWNTPLTPACYLLFAAAGGLTLATLFSGGGSLILPILAAATLAAAWGVKVRWWRRLLTMPPLSTPESATGLGFIGAVRLFERPHMTENYLTREMGYRIARKHAEKLRWLALLAGGAVPILLLCMVAALRGNAGAATAVSALALVSTAAGIAVERWLFFAEARHAVMNYYGA
jgi:sulfite dehydrogenase (quinone) subunit SoeC